MGRRPDQGLAARLVSSLKRKDTRMSPEVFDRGMAIRKSVLGKDFVEKSFAAADDFNMPMQRLVTSSCRGAVWGRDGLPLKIRSMLHIAMRSPLNRTHELTTHLNGRHPN